MTFSIGASVSSFVATKYEKQQKAGSLSAQKFYWSVCDMQSFGCHISVSVKGPSECVVCMGADQGALLLKTYYYQSVIICLSIVELYQISGL